MRTLLVTFGLVLAVASRAQGELIAEFSLAKAGAGGLLQVALCGDRDAYDGAQGCHTRTLEVTGAAVKVRFGGLAPGRYAIKAFHDINRNGKLDTNWMGIPTEPYGFGNDARGRFGPPSFEDAAVTIGHVPVVTAVKLK